MTTTALTIVRAEDCALACAIADLFCANFKTQFGSDAILKGFKDLRRINELNKDVILFIVSPYASGEKSRSIRRFQRKLDKHDKNELPIKYCILSLSDATVESKQLEASLIGLHAKPFHELTIISSDIESKEITNNDATLNCCKIILKSYQNIRKIEKRQTTMKQQRSIRRHLDTDSPTFTLAYGTMTGNAKEIALEIAKKAAKETKYNYTIAGPMELNDLGTKQSFSLLPERRVLVIVVSTTGDGEVPECASRFMRKLRGKIAATKSNENENDLWLKHTQYAILGLGDSNYSQFNAAARNLDMAFQALGAQKFYHTGLADDGTGLEDVVEPWKTGVIKEIYRIWPKIVEEFIQTSSPVATTKQFASGLLLSPETDSGEFKLDSLGEDGILPNETKLSSTFSGAATARSMSSSMASSDMLTDDGLRRNDSTFNLKSYAKNENNNNGNAAAASSSSSSMSSLSLLSMPGLTQNYKVAMASTSSMTSMEEVGTPYLPSPPSMSLMSMIEKNKNITSTFADTMITHKVGATSKPWRPRNFRLRYLDNKSSKEVICKEDTLFLQRFESLNDLQMSFQAYNKNDPFLATIKSAKFLTSESSSNHVMHMEFQLPQGYSYSTGDVMGIYCPNPSYLVNQLLDRLKLSRNTVISIDPISSNMAQVPLPHIPSPASIGNIFEFCIDIRAIPRKGLLSVLAKHCNNEYDRTAMEQLAQTKVRAKNGTIMELLSQFTSCQPPLDALLSLLPPLQPRQYSITSSQCEYPDTAHIAFRILKHDPENVDNMRPISATSSMACNDDDSSVSSINNNNNNNNFTGPQGITQFRFRRVSDVDENTEKTCNSEEEDEIDSIRFETTKVSTTTSEPHYLDGICSCWLYSLAKEGGFLEKSYRISLGYTGAINGNLNKIGGCDIVNIKNGKNRIEIKIPIFFKKATSFRLPAESKSNLIMIGPGTGVAPFRAFLQYRNNEEKCLQNGPDGSSACMGMWRGLGIDMMDEMEQLELLEQNEMMLEEISSSNKDDDDGKKMKKQTGKCLLFFGCRHPDQDYLYKDDFEQFKQSGILDELYVAFSRLQSRKVYVQHLLREQSKNVAELILDENTYIFVCGDASRMAKDVENSIIDILALHNENMDKREATKYVKAMQQNGRYMQDIWSSIITQLQTKLENNKNKSKNKSENENENETTNIEKGKLTIKLNASRNATIISRNVNNSQNDDESPNENEKNCEDDD